MGIRDYKELKVWQKSMELVKSIYRLTKLLPKEETYVLSDQMRRAAVSIPSNIAEGYDRKTDKELIHFLSVARGSCAELETQMLIARDLGYFSGNESDKPMVLCTETRRMLNSFISIVNKEL